MNQVGDLIYRAVAESGRRPDLQGGAGRM